MIEKIKGCLYGGAFGDSLGYPIEFKHIHEIKKKGLLNEPFNISRFSDDTQMTLFTAEGLCVDNKDTINNILSAYKYWYGTQYDLPTHNYSYESKLYKDKRLHSLRAPGNTCLSSLRTNSENVINNSCGCGGVMRVAPIGLIYGPKESYILGCEAARLTHKNPLGYEPAGVLASIISYIMKGEDLEVSIRKAVKLSSSRKLRNILKLAISLVDENIIPLLAFEELGKGWTGHEALAISIYCTLRNINDKEHFKKSLLESVFHDGDSDSTGAITGNILGAFYGISKLPFKKEDIECFDLIDDLSNKLLNKQSL